MPKSNFLKFIIEEADRQDIPERDLNRRAGYDAGYIRAANRKTSISIPALENFLEVLGYELVIRKKK